MSEAKETLEQTAERIVRQEVQVCLSYLVSTLANGEGWGLLAQNQTDMAALMEQAAELAAPVQDYEETAIQAGWKNGGDTIWRPILPVPADESEPSAVCANDWQEACETDNLEPYDREVFEYWVVSDWLADKLIAHGEKVDKDFAGLCVWARTTTGQGIATDSVFAAIAADIQKRG